MRGWNFHLYMGDQAVQEDHRYYIEYSEPCTVNGNFTHWHEGRQRLLADPEKTHQDQIWLLDYPCALKTFADSMSQYRQCLDIWRLQLNPSWDPNSNPFDPVNPWRPTNIKYFRTKLFHWHFENPIMGRPYMYYNGDSGDDFTYSEGETWNSSYDWHNQKVKFSVQRLNDSDDFKEMKIIFG